jgi:hypothetical protein
MELTKVIYFSLLIFISAASSILIVAYISYKIRKLFLGDFETNITEFVLKPMIIALISSKIIAINAIETISKVSSPMQIFRQTRNTFENKILLHDLPKRMKRYFPSQRFIRTAQIINITEGIPERYIEKIAV